MQANVDPDREESSGKGFWALTSECNWSACQLKFANYGNLVKAFVRSSEEQNIKNLLTVIYVPL